MKFLGIQCSVSCKNIYRTETGFFQPAGETLAIRCQQLAILLYTLSVHAGISFIHSFMAYFNNAVP